MNRVIGLAGMLGSSLCMLGSGFAYAHHGVNGQFDTSKTIKVSGMVTKVRLVNPHSYVYFDAESADGNVEEWRCELSSGSLLKRRGWSISLFADGTEITIIGSPARNEDKACYTQTITFSDGNTIGRQDTLDKSGRAIRDADEEEAAPVVQTASTEGKNPDLSGNWVSERPERGPRGSKGGPPPSRDAPSGTADGTRPAGEEGKRPRRRPGGEGGGPPRVELTEAGKAAVLGFEREDNPRFHCQATNILLDWWFDQLVNQIEQTDTDITLTYGFMDIVRTIHLDMDEHPDDIEPGIAGHSIGKWEDNVLLVDTTGFSEGYLHVPPNADGVARNSTALHIVERFTLSDDGTTLTREYTADDELFLVDTFSGQDVVKRTDAAFDNYDCEDLTGDTF